MINCFSNSTGLAVGDLVLIQGQHPVGEVIAIKGNAVTIASRYMTVSLPLQRVEQLEISLQKLEGDTRVSRKRPIGEAGIFVQPPLHFDTEIDLHGMKVEEALYLLARWIDKATVLGYTHLKVIHGKGLGILRREVGNYLRTHVLVKKVIQDHSLPGGHGVTLIEL